MIHFGWRPAILVSAIPAFIIAIIWLYIREPIPSEITNSESKENLNSLVLIKGRRLRTPSFILLTVSYTLQGYVGYIFVTWFYLYLVQVRHFSLLSGAWMSSLPWILSIISIPLGGFVSDRLAQSSMGIKWGRRIVPIIGMAMSGILISIGAHTGIR